MYSTLYDTYLLQLPNILKQRVGLVLVGIGSLRSGPFNKVAILVFELTGSNGHTLANEPDCRE